MRRENFIRCAIDADNINEDYGDCVKKLSKVVKKNVKSTCKVQPRRHGGHREGWRGKIKDLFTSPETLKPLINRILFYDSGIFFLVSRFFLCFLLCVLCDLRGENRKRIQKKSPRCLPRELSVVGHVFSFSLNFKNRLSYLTVTACLRPLGRISPPDARRTSSL